MDPKYAYWLFKGALPEKDRNKIKRIARKSGYSLARTQRDHKREDHDASNRSTDVAFSSNQFLYDTLCPFVHSANDKAGWKYDLDWFDAIQIAMYKKNQHYDWHTDGANDHFAAYRSGENLQGKVRKVSCISVLSNGYVGGGLELALQRQDCENEVISPEMDVGDVIVFPSYIYHRSTPILKGTKYSVAMWCLGPPFR